MAKNNEAVESEGLAELSVCIKQHPGFHAVCFNLAGFCRWHGSNISSNTKILTKAHPTNKIDTLPIGSWRGGAAVFWERKCEWFWHHVLLVAYERTSRHQSSKKTSYLKDFTSQTCLNCFKTVVVLKLSLYLTPLVCWDFP